MRTPEDDDAVVLARGLSVRLGGVTIIDDLDLELRSGEALWLEGPNGAGKTTLLRALAGLIAFDGDVHVEGVRVGQQAAMGRYRLVPDTPPLFEDLSVREHAELLGRISGRAGADAEALQWCARFGLDAHLDHYPGVLSRGMRQKLSLAVALAGAPALLLLDEPFNALDADAQTVLLEALLAHAAAGRAVIVSGHQADLAARWSGRRARLSAGALTPVDR
jgi:ABC-2 type transport system ATP-binding protein